MIPLTLLLGTQVMMFLETTLYITDTNNNTGNEILRYLTHLLSTDGTLNGLDVFQYPELVLDNGSAYKISKMYSERLRVMLQWV